MFIWVEATSVDRSRIYIGDHQNDFSSAASIQRRRVIFERKLTLLLVETCRVVGLFVAYYSRPHRWIFSPPSPLAMSRRKRLTRTGPKCEHLIVLFLVWWLIDRWCLAGPHVTQWRKKQDHIHYTIVGVRLAMGQSLCRVFYAFNCFAISWYFAISFFSLHTLSPMRFFLHSFSRSLSVN